MIPLAGLPDDFWMHDETTQSLSGRRSRVVFHLAQTVTVRLAEARPVTGGLLFQMAVPGAEARDNPRDSESGPRRGGRQPRSRAP
jgi:ribonuclease R